MYLLCSVHVCVCVCVCVRERESEILCVKERVGNVSTL